MRESDLFINYTGTKSTQQIVFSCFKDIDKIVEDAGFFFFEGKIPLPRDTEFKVHKLGRKTNR